MAQVITLTGVVTPPIIGSPTIAQPVVNDFQRLLYYTDLDEVFMNLEEFAIEISYWHSSLDEWVSYPVLFDDPHASVSLGAEGEFNTRRPQFQISEARLKQRILKKDRCSINGVEYRIEDYVSDGVGVTTVFLRKK